ncbi:DUF3253 domain-containing protein [Aquipuribacter sp. MA13-6]|uniref:DUF3253 domain-containing protein n=1 Tax=unclassified Aquipuribacter TaxID=2635084 RepID=UPI003EEFA666
MPSRRRAGAPTTPEPKTCVVCGRTIEWRARWARDWEQVRYCSQGCRRRGLGDVDAELERTTLALLDARARTATVCPSEVARSVAGPDADEAAWRALMEPARMAARRLVAGGQVEITQGGRVVDPSTAKGAIRLRRTR